MKTLTCLILALMMGAMTLFTSPRLQGAVNNPHATPSPVGTVDVTVDWGNPLRQVPTFAYGVNSPANFIPSYSSNPTFMGNLQWITQKKGFVRLHGWGMLGSSPEAWQSGGVWNSTKIDQALRPLVTGGYTVMINIPSGPQGEHDYGDPVAFARFCADLVQIVNVDHGLGIRYWEIPNEREAGFAGPGLSVSEMATLMAAARQAMKAVDPSILVGGPATAWVNVDYVSQLVTALYPNIDFVTLHTYSGDGLNSLGNAYDIAQGAIADLAEVRSRLDLITGPAQLPIFLTEYNIAYQGTPRIETHEGAVYDALILAGCMQAGANASMFWNVAPYSDMSLIDGSHLHATAHLYKVFNESFHGSLVQSHSSSPAEVQIYAVSGANFGRRAFCLINRTPTPQPIQLNFTGWLPTKLQRHQWDSNNNATTSQINWSALNSGSFTLPAYSVQLFTGRNYSVRGASSLPPR